jgi:ADP-ribose pyrophosphatase YjhB (NUDIX family)
MPKHGPRPKFAAGIIERHDNHVLIALPRTNAQHPREWQFPRGAVRPDESPEAAMRRIAPETVGLTVEIVVGQPPLLAPIEGREVELRYFFCGVVDGQLHSEVYAELRWISTAHLREYDFDEPSRAVVEWLLHR